MQPTREEVEELLSIAGDFTGREHLNTLFNYYEALSGQKLKNKEKCSSCYQMALNFLWNFVGIKKRFKLATKKTAIERIKICEGCPELFKPTYSCKQCGCFVRVKSYLATQECPLGKW